jgi:hypothetical protein
MTTSQYHAESLDCLGMSGIPDPTAIGQLRSRFAELGISLPASVAEWFGMRDGVELLQRYSDCDQPIALEHLGEPLQWCWGKERDCIREGLLPFMVEHQGVCLWAVRLDAGDDPPVMIARDPDLEWHPCASSFSTFVACQVWDHAEVLADASDRVVLAAQAAPLRKVDLEFLRVRFHERPTTHGWPGKHQYRFDRDDARVLVRDGGDQADWWLATSSQGSAKALAREVWCCADLATSLWSNDPRGAGVLQRLRGCAW